MDCFQCLTLAFYDYSWEDFNMKSDNLELGWFNLLKIIIELLNISAKKTDSEYDFPLMMSCIGLSIKLFKCSVKTPSNNFKENFIDWDAALLCWLSCQEVEKKIYRICPTLHRKCTNLNSALTAHFHFDITIIFTWFHYTDCQIKELFTSAY